MKLIHYSLLCLLYILISCGPETTTEIKNDPENIKEGVELLKKYYYPLTEMEQGLVYEYVDAENGHLVTYWVYKTIKEGDKQYLEGTSYNPFFKEEQYSKELIVGNGTILKEYKFIQTDSASGQQVRRAAKIEESVVFPFEAVTDTSLAYRFRMKFSLLPDTMTFFDLVRDRKFGDYIRYTFEDKDIKAVKFNSKEFIEIQNPAEGGHWNQNSEMKEVFAEGIGLVYTQKTSPGVSYKHRLNRRLSLMEFDKLKEKAGH